MNEPENVWAWKCEECCEWRFPDSPVYAVIVREPGPTIHTLHGTETLGVNRKMVVCERCFKTMRVPTA